MLTRPFRIVAGAVQLFLVLVPTVTRAGVDTAWVRSYNGTGGGGDAVNSMVLDSEGNVYVTGWSRGAGTGWDCATLKYDSLGTQLWALVYSSPSLQTGYDQGLSLALDGAGGLFIVGESEGLGTNYDFFVVRCTGTGETAWTRRYNGPGNGRDGACAVATDDSGGAYVTGGSDDGVGAGIDWTTIRYNAGGDTQWVRRHNGSANASDAPGAVVVDRSGAAYVVGYCTNLETSGDATITKYDRDGSTAWTRSVNGAASGFDTFRSATFDDSGHLYVTGNAAGVGTGGDVLTCKYNSQGDALWTRTYNRYYDQYGLEVAVDQAGNVYVTGISVPPDSSPTSCLTVKYSPVGRQEWVAWYEGPVQSWNAGYSVAVDSAGSCYAAGFTQALGSLEDWAIVKYNTDGAQQWACTYDGAGHGGDRARAVQISPNGSIYVSGWAVQASGSMDYTTTRYRQTTGAVEELHNVRTMRLCVEPNPAQRTARVTFGRVASGLSRIALYDAAGTLVLDRVVSAAARQLAIDVSGLSAGVYLVRVQSDGLNATQKLIVQH